MPANSFRFADLVERIDRLSPEQQEDLVKVMRQRMSKRQRKYITAGVHATDQDHRRGRYKLTPADKLIREILG